MGTESGLVVEVDGRVGRLTIDRQERLNAMTSALQADMVDAIDRLARDDDVWVIVVTGAGTRAFSSGVDLYELQEASAEGLGVRPPMAGVGRNLFEVLVECPKPTIAALNGYAVGGGCELALACDLRVAADTARIGMPEAKRGLAGHFGAQMLPRLIPVGLAYELLYFGELIDATSAAEIGLINEVVPAADFEMFVSSYAERLLASAPITVRRYKAAITAGRDLPLSAALRLQVGPDPYSSRDKIEGIAAFRDRRAPQWENA